MKQLQQKLSQDVIGERIKIARKLKKWSREYLAEKLEVSSKTVYNWEAGIYYPEMPRFFEICEVLEVSPSSMLHL